MEKLKRYADIQAMVDRIERLFPENEKTSAILMMNELEALRNIQEVSSAKSALKHVIERSVENGQVCRRVAVYNASDMDADTARDEVAIGKIREDSFIVVPQESVAGRFWTERRATPKKPEQTEE